MYNDDMLNICRVRKKLIVLSKQCYLTNIQNMIHIHTNIKIYSVKQFKYENDNSS